MTGTPPLFQPARGQMPVLQFCSLAQLAVDATYQRPTDAPPSRTLINRIARLWDWGLYQPLVVARRADGGLYVVDGQHRLEAARMRTDIPQLPCVITAYDGAPDEAAAFVALNQQRRPLTKMNMFKAALAAGDADATIVAGLIDRAGLRLTGAADAATWKPGWINNIVEIQQAHRQHGERITRIALEVLATAFAGHVLRHCGTLFGAVLHVLVEHGDKLPAALLIDIMREPPDAWMERIRLAASERAIGTMLAAKQLASEAVAEALAE